MLENEKQLRYDFLPLKIPGLNPNGKTARLPATFQRAGVFDYYSMSGRVVREFRPPQEVLSKSMLEKHIDLPVLLGHTFDFSKTNSLAIGLTQNPVISEEKMAVEGEIVIFGEKALREISQPKGFRQLSPGYTARLLRENGEWNGQRYDYIQTEIEIDHIAIVEQGRQGDVVSLHLDSDQCKFDELAYQLPFDSLEKERGGNITYIFFNHAEESMKKTKIDSLEAIANYGSSPESAIEPSAIEHSTVEHSTIEHSTIEHSTIEPPTIETPTIETPTIETPTIETPTIEPPTIEPPTVEPPTIEPPTIEVSTIEPPTIEPPTIEPPTIEPPTIEPPTIEPPTTETPTVGATTVEPPTTEPPTIEPPTTEPPTTEPPTIEPPTTETPTVGATTVEPPTIEAKEISELRNIAKQIINSVAKLTEGFFNKEEAERLKKEIEERNDSIDNLVKAKAIDIANGASKILDLASEANVTMSMVDVISDPDTQVRKIAEVIFGESSGDIETLVSRLDGAVAFIRKSKDTKSQTKTEKTDSAETENSVSVSEFLKKEGKDTGRKNMLVLISEKEKSLKI